MLPVALNGEQQIESPKSLAEAEQQLRAINHELAITRIGYMVEPVDGNSYLREYQQDVEETNRAFEGLLGGNPREPQFNRWHSRQTMAVAVCAEGVFSPLAYAAPVTTSHADRLAEMLRATTSRLDNLDDVLSYAVETNNTDAIRNLTIAISCRPGQATPKYLLENPARGADSVRADIRASRNELRRLYPAEMAKIGNGRYDSPEHMRTAVWRMRQQVNDKSPYVLGIGELTEAEKLVAENLGLTHPGQRQSIRMITRIAAAVGDAFAVREAGQSPMGAMKYLRLTNRLLDYAKQQANPEALITIGAALTLVPGQTVTDYWKNNPEQLPFLEHIVHDYALRAANDLKVVALMGPARPARPYAMPYEPAAAVSERIQTNEPATHSIEAFQPAETTEARVVPVLTATRTTATEQHERVAIIEPALENATITSGGQEQSDDTAHDTFWQPLTESDLALREAMGWTKGIEFGQGEVVTHLGRSATGTPWLRTNQDRYFPLTESRS